MEKETIIKLIEQAISAREKAYTPYSGFNVGAALLSENGNITTGCNIENASYSPTNCAERTAFFKAVSEGERGFTAIAITAKPKSGEPVCAFPCGVCRQVMMEFTNPKSFLIIVAKATDDYSTHTLEELLPNGFGPADLS